LIAPTIPSINRLQHPVHNRFLNLMDELELIIDSGEKSDEKRSRRATKAIKITHQSRFRRGWMVILGIFVVAVILGLQLAQQNRVQPMPGEPAPTFTITTFDDETISLEALRGKIVIVNFWADWCPPCHQEAPDMVAIAEDYVDKNVVMVGINWLESKSTALNFIARYEVPYQNGLDLGGKISQAYRLEAAPETYVIDRNGIVADTIIGPTTYDHLAEVLDGLIAKGGAS
jgi:cytochrome c biogenesis protein CcmG, thiol:disulfide interchange protein DsbE